MSERCECGQYLDDEHDDIDCIAAILAIGEDDDEWPD